MGITERLQGTQTGSVDPIGARTLTRVFDVIGYDSLKTAPAGVDSLVVPNQATYEVGRVFNHDTNEMVDAVATYYGQKSWTRPEGENDHWIITLTYSTAPSASGGGGTDPVLITTQGESSVGTKNIYRRNPTGDVDNPTNDDIGGVRVDAGGVPTTVVSVDRRFSTTEKQVTFPTLGAYSGLVGKRNADPYEGGGIGEILYLGFAWNYETETGLWAITHQFAVDKSYHHAEQVARTDPQGVVITDVNNTEDFWQAKHVVWIQLFGTGTFGNTLPDF